jgi:ABC-2 type transport system ATP-binding protein
VRPAIEARGLVKVFGNNRAVDGIDLTVPTGCIYGVLGPNGAGKTTVINILATLLKADGGLPKYSVMTYSMKLKLSVSSLV